MKTKLAFLLAAAGMFTNLSAHAGTVDVGSGSITNKVALSEQLNSFLTLNMSYSGRILKETKTGEILTADKCSVVANVIDGKLSVEIINVSLMEQGAESHLATTLFEAKADGSDLLLDPSVLHLKEGTEFSLINNFGLKTQNLLIRSNEGTSDVSISQKSASDFNVAATKVICSLDSAE